MRRLFIAVANHSVMGGGGAAKGKLDGCISKFRIILSNPKISPSRCLQVTRALGCTPSTCKNRKNG